MNEKAPTREQRLNQYLGGNDHSTNPKSPIRSNNLKVLEEIATKWASRRLYKSSNRAMIALLGGVQ